jgi:predicted acetylornithine/succinylornithine family transaminase
MTQEADKIIEDAFEVLVKTYKPQPVVMDHGEGVYAWDTDGKKYLDCAAGIAVASLGHAHPKMMQTIAEQSKRLMACQASYATKEKLKAARFLTDHTCFDLIYFSNSGTESVEASIKCARKWAYEEKGPECTEIIAFRKSFHGRTMGSASLTEKSHSQPFFAPYLPGVKWATFNDLDSVRDVVSDKTAAIIVEPIQGEGGLMPADPWFLQGLRQICDEENICLIFDEVQAGMGRLGYFNAYEAFECCPECVETDGPVQDGKAVPVEPDIAAWAKGMGSGFPVGAMGAKEKFGKAIQPGTHGTTYGGNPLACAVAHTVMSEVAQPEFLAHVREMGGRLYDGLSKIQRDSNKITGIRGKGLMVGVDTTVEIGDLLRCLQKNGLMATQAGAATLRLTPPLIITADQVDAALDIIDKTLKEK